MSIESPIIGYTLGDQAGIGPEVIREALRQVPAGAEYRLIGQAIDCQPGIPTEQTAGAALEHLELAAEALRNGTIDAVVTAPICKEALHKLGFAYPGQTEFFADRLGVRDYAMCLTGRRLTVALCTTHVALADVSSLLHTEEIVRVGSLLARFLIRTGCQHPHIALAGLNPHNGENGAFGHEESTIIAPALPLLRQSMPTAEFSGPCVPDCVYRNAAAGMYHGIIAPYHDQALIPLKLLDFDNAVNATIGLPRLRVSPDHGTAFSIAGKGLASAASTLRAFQVALSSVR